MGILITSPWWDFLLVYPTSSHRSMREAAFGLMGVWRMGRQGGTPTVVISIPSVVIQLPSWQLQLPPQWICLGRAVEGFADPKRRAAHGQLFYVSISESYFVYYQGRLVCLFHLIVSSFLMCCLFVKVGCYFVP